MPDEIYEIIALAARYWFLFLMVLIAWRSYRWYARDRKKYKKRLKLLPDAGYIGELVVVQGDEIVTRRHLPSGRPRRGAGLSAFKRRLSCRWAASPTGTCGTRSTIRTACWWSRCAAA